MNIERNYALTINTFNGGFSLFNATTGECAHFGPCTWHDDDKWSLRVPKGIIKAYWTSDHENDDPEPVGDFVAIPVEVFIAKNGVTEA
jgi:hypothetical protein